MSGPVRVQQPQAWTWTRPGGPVQAEQRTWTWTWVRVQFGSEQGSTNQKSINFVFLEETNNVPLTRRQHILVEHQGILRCVPHVEKDDWVREAWFTCLGVLQGRCWWTYGLWAGWGVANVWVTMPPRWCFRDWVGRDGFIRFEKHLTWNEMSHTIPFDASDPESVKSSCPHEILPSARHKSDVHTHIDNPPRCWNWHQLVAFQLWTFQKHTSA